MAKAFPLFAVEPEGTLAVNATLMLHTRLAEMYRFAGEIDNVERVEELHNMRIAAKRLRYTMEIFAAAFPGPEFEGFYESVKSIQEQIGDIHDCDVRVPLIESFLADAVDSRPEIKIGLARAIEAERTKRDKLYAKFCRFWRKLQAAKFHHRFLELLVGLEDAETDPVTASESSDQAPQHRRRRRAEASVET